MEEELAPTPAELHLPECFIGFLHKNGLDPSIYATPYSTPRYIRLKPGHELSEIEAEFNCELKQVPWLPRFYKLPPDVRISNTNVYREGKIYGVDAASGAAVLALGISQGDHVLDLCAAPGAKLCMILDILGSSSGSVTAVDVARHRLATTRTMMRKYGLGDGCRLFVADGTKFSLCPLRASRSNQENSETYGHWTPHRPYKERKRAAKARQNQMAAAHDPELIFYGPHSGVVGSTKHDVYSNHSELEISSQLGYDKVLVDAECTHDGSIKHIHKFERWGWATLSARVLGAQRTDVDVTVVQLKLLANGFRLLKVGGNLVYSTCSLTVTQNEGVVEEFLSVHLSAELVEIENAESWPCREGRISKTVRFDPLTSGTSGLFIAKFTKVAI